MISRTISSGADIIVAVHVLYHIQIADHSGQTYPVQEHETVWCLVKCLRVKLLHLLYEISPTVRGHFNKQDKTRAAGNRLRLPLALSTHSRLCTLVFKLKTRALKIPTI